MPSKNKDQVTASNLKTYTPAILLKHGQLQYQLFNNLYTQTNWYNADGERTPLNQRATYSTTTINFVYGISKSRRINLGVDLNFQSVRNDLKSNSPFAIYKFEKSVNTRTAVSYFGPKIKIAPFGKSNISFQTSFWIPTVDNLEGWYNSETDKKPFLAYNRNIWWTQAFFDKSIGTNFKIFSAAEVIYRIKRKPSDISEIATPVSAFLSYFPSNKMTFYTNTQYWPVWGNTLIDVEGTKEFGQKGYFIQSGIGGKYQLTTQLELELLYTKFIKGKAQGAGQTYNFGLRYFM